MTRSQYSLPSGWWPCPTCGAYQQPTATGCRCGYRRPATEQAKEGRFVDIPATGIAGKVENGGKVAKKRGAIRPLNKTETRFMVDVLGKLPGAVSIHPQALVLDFGDGTSYRPDFATVDASGVISVWEVKGGHVGKVAWSRHGIERFKRAKEKWRHIRFVLAKWTGKKWEVET